tara:strand:+ start:3566 stop:4555 length:990 start_codon:yes stop_codon:yes gene_type:complete
MIISKTPFRLSFIGGGTDQIPCINLLGKGHVINSTFNKYGYIFYREIEDLYDYNFKIRYYLNESVKLAKDIKHPVIRHAVNQYNLDNKKFHITYDGELPSRSGIGSSSSFVVGLLNIIYFIKKEKISKISLAKKAINFEHRILKENSGLQDQIAASYGGLNYISFNKNSFKVQKIKLSNEKKEIIKNSIFLCLVNGSRKSSNLEKEKNKDLLLNKNIYSDIYDLTTEALNALNSKKTTWFSDFNKCINSYWSLKKRLNKKVSNEEVNYLCDSFMREGALSVKLMGAGDNGFISIISTQTVRNRIINKFKKCKFITIQTEDEGSKIINIK